MEKFTTLSDRELDEIIEVLTEGLNSDDQKEIEHRQRLLRYATEEKERR